MAPSGDRLALPLACVVICLATERALRRQLPRRSLGAITQWSVASVVWVWIVQRSVPPALLRSPVACIGVAWPLVIAVAESLAVAAGESPRENRGSVQMDMGVLLNIGFSLSTASALASDKGKRDSARCVTLFTSSVVVICLCFLIPNPLLFRAGVYQKVAITLATGMLLISSSVSMDLKMCD